LAYEVQVKILFLLIILSLVLSLSSCNSANKVQRLIPPEEEYVMINKRGGFCSFDPEKNVITAAAFSPFGFMAYHPDFRYIEDSDSETRKERKKIALPNSENMLSSNSSKSDGKIYILGGKFMVNHHNFANK
jgi:hypothetical protein